MMTVNYFLLLFLLGLAVGSFANVCFARLPADQSLLFPSSHCPQCDHTLLRRHNVPILSFIFLKGRCAFCRHPISWRYPAVELAMGVLYVLLGARYAHHLPLMFLSLFLAFEFVTITLIDYHYKIIPDELSLSLIVLGLASAAWNPLLGHSAMNPILMSLLCALGGGVMMLGMAWLGEKLFHQEALGGGDIKLVAGIGACLGGPGLYVSILLGSLSGGVVGLLLMALRRKRKGDTIPFGPFLCLGAFISFLYPAFLKRILFP